VRKGGNGMENVFFLEPGKEGKMNVFVTFKRNLGDYEMVELSNSFTLTTNDKQFVDTVKEILTNKLLPSIDLIEAEIRKRERELIENRIKAIKDALEKETNPAIRRRLEDYRQLLISKALKVADDIEWFMDIQK
jgi:hypothetical protein